MEPGLQAVRANLRPFLLIQGLAVLLLAAYYSLPAFQRAGEPLEAFKLRAGLPFSALSTAFAGYVLPWIAKKITKVPVHDGWKDVLFQCSFFALIGSIIDLWYQGLTQVISSGTSLATVAFKVFADQAVFSPLVSIPLSVTLFAWHRAGFSIPSMMRAFSGGGFFQRYATLMLMCWAFWIPILFVVFAMPAGLQFWMFLCAQGAWSLLLIHVSGMAK